MTELNNLLVQEKISNEIPKKIKLRLVRYKKETIDLEKTEGERMKKQFRTYEETVKIIQKYSLKSNKEWRIFSKSKNFPILSQQIPTKYIRIKVGLVGAIF